MTKDEALKLALEALEQLDGIDTETECVTIDVGDVMTAVREALAEQPAQQQEPVGLIVVKSGCAHFPISMDFRSVPDGEYKLYTSPQASKPWVGLTDEEFQFIYATGNTPAGMMEMVEAKLKEKNT